MKQSIIFVGFGLIVALISLGCGTSNQLAAEIVYDARAQVNSAKEVEAQSLASQELADAEQMLSRAEDALSAGKEKESYRLGMRAYLKSKVAEAIAIANRIETKARTAEQELELKVQAMEAARRALGQAERELAQLRSTPVENLDPIGEE
jgi:type IV secretory pathway TrbL component